MVRINLIDPRKLADQHLIAEYNEILMLLDYVKKYPSIDNTPENYILGKGHIKFFKDKLQYLKDRHDVIKNEMHNRNFSTNISVDLNGFSEELINNWQPKKNGQRYYKRKIKEKN